MSFSAKMQPISRLLPLPGKIPEFFQQDALLGEPKNFRFYQTVHLYILPWLKKLVGDYGTAFISTLGITVFLQLLGFYLLGWLLLGDRFLAVLLAILSLSHVRLNMLSDYWGFFSDPLPRNTFQAFLPFLLSAAYYWRQQPRYWPGLMALAGLGMYHPSGQRPDLGGGHLAGIFGLCTSIVVLGQKNLCIVR